MVVEKEIELEINKRIGSVVKQARILKAMSIRALADELGITKQQLDKNEKGENRISAARLVMIADILSMDIKYFFDPITKKIDCVEEVKKREIDLLSEYMKIKDGKTKKIILDVVKMMVEEK